jgi:hypothetical protein
MKIWAKKNLINQHQGRQGPQEHHMTDDRFSYTKGMSTTKRRFNSNVHTSKQTKSLDVALLILPSTVTMQDKCYSEQK